MGAEVVVFLCGRRLFQIAAQLQRAILADEEVVADPRPTPLAMPAVDHRPSCAPGRSDAEQWTNTRSTGRAGF